MGKFRHLRPPASTPLVPVVHTFAARIQKQTGDGELLEVSFSAATGEELATRAKEAFAVGQSRMLENNGRVLNVLDEINRREAERAAAAAVPQAPNGAAGDAGADDPAGAVHAPTDP